MSLQIGIVGLPNVGKSTLFNALTKSHSAEAANYPFCTINPNVGIVEVPDPRLKELGKIYDSKKIIPTAIEFVDIAGLVKGASKGEGLGNQFLANIRECDAIVQVVRDFSDSNIQHVSAEPDPASDIETIETELILADLNTVEKKFSEYEKKSRTGDKKMLRALELIGEIKTALENEKPAISVEVPADPEDQATVRELHLLTSKPMLYAVNVAEKELVNFDTDTFRKEAGLSENTKIIPVSAKAEAELGELSDEDAVEFLTDLGLKESSLNRLIHEAYSALNLITFLTAGPQETRAWTVRNGALAPEAAGVIHTDFQTGFIRAEIIKYEKLIEAGSETSAKEKGWIGVEGKEYEIKDGDICHFRFNV